MITPTDILKAKILIVDDKDANVKLIEGMLRVAGYTAVHSTTESNAVCGLHDENHYDLILLDLLMPGLDGFQVMEGLNQVEEGGYLPVLVITAQPDHKLRALNAGAKDFVSKPFELPELLARVRNILEVRLLHLETIRTAELLLKTVRELEASRETVRLKTEQEYLLARKTQESLLPHHLPQLENYRIHAYNNATRFVGGDFYDFQQLGAAEWMGVLADASGKGMSAALLSSMVLGALCMEFRPGTEPHEVLNRLNQILCKKSLPNQFVTLFLFLLNPAGVGQFISAGHTPTYVFRAATRKLEELVSDGYMLGMFDFATYRPRRFHLEKGDVLIAYTDGLTKAENQKGEAFGAERLMEIIELEGAAGSLAVERALLTSLDSFTDGMPQPDDITFLVVEKFQ